MKCAVCEAAEPGSSPELANLGEVHAHRREQHPGVKSPTNKSRAKNKRTRSAPAPRSNAGAAGATGAAAPGGALESGPTDAPAPELDADVPPEFRPLVDDELEEIAPAAPARRSWRDRLWGVGRGAKRGGELVPSTRARPAKRESTSSLIAAAWGGAGALLTRYHVDEPVGRCLTFQAPIAGEVLESLSAGTWIDRAVLQPIARNTEQAEAAAALFALPALIFMYPRLPEEAQPGLEPFMQEAVRAHMRAMVPVIRKKRAREREDQKVVDELKAEGMIAPDATSAEAVDAIMFTIFGAATPHERAKADVQPQPGPSTVHGGVVNGVPA